MLSVQARSPSLVLGTDMVVVDSLCPQLCSLVQDVRWVFLLTGSATTPIEVIGEALAGQELDILHVVAHGRSGGFKLGGPWIDRQTLIASAACLARWNVHRLALGRCSLSQYRGLIARLAELIGGEALEQ